MSLTKIILIAVFIVFILINKALEHRYNTIGLTKIGRRVQQVLTYLISADAAVLIFFSTKSGTIAIIILTILSLYWLGRSILIKLDCDEWEMFDSEEDEENEEQTIDSNQESQEEEDK